MTNHISVIDADHIRTIRMNRPEKKNAITFAMYESMAAALEGANADDALRCIIIAGTQGAFSAGNDLKDFLKVMESPDAPNRPATRFMRSVALCRKPIVAAVNGLAVGIGATMLFHCDFVVAATDARLSTPFVSLGLVPEAASSLLAPLLFGHRRAFEFLVMGHALTASDAKSLGLINLIVAPDEVDARAVQAAREIAQLPVQAVQISRRLLRDCVDTLLARMDQENAIFTERLRSPEPRAAIEAFVRRDR